MLIKVLEKNENGFITAYKNVTEEYENIEIKIDTGKKDENGDTIFSSDTEKKYLQEDGIDYFTVSIEDEENFINNCENFKIYRKKIKYYQPEIMEEKNIKKLKEQLFLLVIKRDTLEKEGIDVSDYNLEIENLKNIIKEQTNILF